VAGPSVVGVVAGSTAFDGSTDGIGDGVGLVLLTGTPIVDRPESS
jgi:hypothetical protein